MTGPTATMVEMMGEAFPPGPWRWLLLATGVLLVASVVAGGLSRWLRRRGKSRSEALPDFDASTIRQTLEEVRSRVQAYLAGPESDAVGILHELMRGALLVKASDIHCSPLAAGLTITYRVHGSLTAVDTLPSSVAPLIVNRIKVLSRLDLHVHNVPQDGRLVTRISSQVVEARVSTLPTEGGERVVLRLVKGGRAVPTLDSLGLSESVHSGMVGLLARPQGLLFVTGPVGSGKTTTLYAALDHIAQTRGQTTTLVTLEDPIELELPFATQTQMHVRAGMTFASTLRSVLRQDPNVLMLGEIRDPETADIAMQAGLTGHLILTTVHADHSAGPFARLIDMKIEPFLLASSTIGCLSQRLVRTLCPACRRPAPPETIHQERFGRLGIELTEGNFFEPVGCNLCEGQGFAGRTPIAELLVVDTALRQAVHDCLPSERIREMAVAAGMTPLVEDGLRRARQGETSLTEVLRVAG